ncbi:MAG: Holliday junction resolvase RuvX [Candidatus Neomarinimicrobiota bacterium]
MARILGIDHGERRVGLAVSDPAGIIAQPLTTLLRGPSDDWWGALGEIITEQEVEAIVVGYPRTMGGEIGSQADKVDRFIGQLEQRWALPVHRFDERLTSVAARRSLTLQGVKSGHDKAAVDRTAAALILQDFLDSRR